MEIRFATLDEILSLRQQMIIAGTDRDSPYFPEDQDVLTRHLAIFDAGQCIGCATLVSSGWEGRPAWQVRGMATAMDRQRQGLGSALLRYCEDHVSVVTTRADFWCNARVVAVGFYEKNGWQVVSERFEIPHVGPHYRMHRAYPIGD